MPIDFPSSFKVQIRELYTSHTLIVRSNCHFTDLIVPAAVLDQYEIVIIDATTHCNMVNLIVIDWKFVDAWVFVVVLCFGLDEDIREGSGERCLLHTSKI